MSKYESRGDYHYQAFKRDGDPYREHMLDVIEHACGLLGTDSTVLDVGAGEGLLIDQLMKSGLYCLGCEVDAHAVAIAANKGNPVIKGTISRFGGWTFDAVMALDVLEHVGDPFDLFQRMFDRATTAVFVALPSQDDPHAVNEVTIDKLLEQLPSGWVEHHREVRHSRDFIIFTRASVEDSDAIRRRYLNKAVEAMSEGGSEQVYDHGDRVGSHENPDVF